jgi:hypothetical protein
MQGFVWKSYTCHYHPGLFYVLTSNKQLFGVGADSCEGQNREIFASDQIDWTVGKDFRNVKGVAYGYGPGWLFKFLHRILHWFKSCAFSTQ